MIDRGVPPLALALSAATSSALGLEERELGAEFLGTFARAVAEMDEADGAYRRAIEETLSPDSADAMLSAMAAFREQIRELRRQTRQEISEIYRRYDRSYGWFDPLDTYAPPAAGLSHADGTRVATIGDSARSRVDALRAQVNDAVAKHLERAQIETLIAAKRRRRDAFAAALKRALETAVAAGTTVTAAEVEKAVHRLTQLADGWY